MTAEPIAFDAEFSDPGHLRVPSEAAALLRDQLGHEPRAGDIVHVSVVSRPAPSRSSSYGRLRHLAPRLGKVDLAAIRKDLTAEVDGARELAGVTDRYASAAVVGTCRPAPV